MKPAKSLAAIAVAAAMTASTYVVADELGDGNRYNRDRFYASEISNSEAYLAMMQNKAVILDVRSLREYSAGHPERAYNVPYPRIDGGPPQDPAVFYWEVYDIVKGKLDTPLVTVCRTGSRSIAAANILAQGGIWVDDPASTDENPLPQIFVQFGEPFTNVRNHWPGFVGQYLYAFNGGTIALDENNKPIPLDLNNDGELNKDEADVFSHTKDKNPDKDGWRNFANLPFSTQIRRPLAYLNDVSLYAEYFLESDTPPQARRPKIGR
jgi:rhodanese-related sulfurtransferase